MIYDNIFIRHTNQSLLLLQSTKSKGQNLN